MTRPVQSFQATRQISMSSTLEFIEIDQDLHAFRQVVSSKGGKHTPDSTSKTPRSAMPSSTRTGIVDAAGRQKLMQGQAASILKLTVLTDAQIEGLRTLGWSEMEEEIYKTLPQDPFELFRTNPDLSADNVVRLDPAGHMMFDRHDQPLPVALVFDYIRNHISESSHNLPALAAHLVKHPNIEVTKIPQRHEGRVRTTDPVEAISEIPYYNAENGRTKTVEFIWMPTVEQYRMLWAECKGEYPSAALHRNFFAMDFADIAQFQRDRPSPRSPGNRR